MNPTKLQLLRNEAAEVLAANANELPWHSYVAMVFGYLLFLVAAFVLLFVLIDVLTERRWLRAGRKLTDPDIPPLQGIVSPHEIRNWNRTSTLTFKDFEREVNE